MDLNFESVVWNKKLGVQEGGLYTERVSISKSNFGQKRYILLPTDVLQKRSGNKWTQPCRLGHYRAVIHGINYFGFIER